MVCPEPMITNGKVKVESATSEEYITGSGVTAVYSFDADYMLREGVFNQRERVNQSERAVASKGDNNSYLKCDLAGGRLLAAGQ